MYDYRKNAKWLVYFAPFRSLSISAAYLVPFFLYKGLDLASIFLLQSIFSLAVVLLEVPSGWLADKIGRSLSIKISVPIAGFSLISYAFVDQFWQFAVIEILLAASEVLISGADQALLIDSLKYHKKDNEYVKYAQRMHSIGFASIFAALPISLALVNWAGLSAVIAADGLLILLGGIFAFKLREPPLHEAEELSGENAIKASKALLKRGESRWLILMSVLLGASTYIGAWVAAPYYESIGIQLIWFSVIYAVRALIKSIISHRIKIEHRLKRSLRLFIVFAAVPYFAMALGVPLLAFALVLHDVIHALQASALAHRYNKYISSKYRAMLNSIVGMQSRLAYAVLGPLAGFAISRFGFELGLAIIGASFAIMIGHAYLRLIKLGALK